MTNISRLAGQIKQQHQPWHLSYRSTMQKMVYSTEYNYY